MDNLYNYLSNSSILRKNGVIIKVIEYDFKQFHIILPKETIVHSISIKPTRWYGFEISLTNSEGQIIYIDDIGYSECRCFDAESDVEDEILRIISIGNCK